MGIVSRESMTLMFYSVELSRPLTSPFSIILFFDRFTFFYSVFKLFTRAFLKGRYNDNSDNSDNSHFFEICLYFLYVPVDSLPYLVLFYY